MPSKPEVFLVQQKKQTRSRIVNLGVSHKPLSLPLSTSLWHRYKCYVQKMMRYQITSNPLKELDEKFFPNFSLFIQSLFSLFRFRFIINQFLIQLHIFWTLLPFNTIVAEVDLLICSQQPFDSSNFRPEFGFRNLIQQFICFII